MRKHTKEFKSSISTFGRELDSKITVLGTELILEKEDLFSITPITNSALLKTVMKEVDFESKKQIGIGQEVNIKSGVKVNGEYEYIDYGNYSVYKSEYKAETDTYSHICYDKMLKTMIDYTPLDITYPINLREYITAIATKCGLEFADKNSTFANYNTAINEDHFSNGNYTFRDVLDYIAQLVGGWLCINDNDELEIRYPELAKNYGEANGENVSFISNVEDEINTIIIDGKSTQETSTQSANLCPPFTDSRWTFTNGVSVTNEGYLSIPATTGARAIITIPWNKSRTCYFKDIIVSGGNAHYSGEYFDENGKLLSSNGKATIDKGANYQDGTMWGGNNQYGDALTQATSIKFTIQFSSYTPNPYVIKDLIISENNINYIPFTPNMPSPDYPSEIESVGYENLFNRLMSNYSSINGSITIDSSSNNSITLTLPSTGGSYDAVRYNSVANLVVGKTYTISANIVGNNNSLIRVVKNNSGTSSNILGNVKNDKPFTFTYDGSYNSLGLFLYVSHGVQPTEDLTATFSNIQIEEGSQSHSYIPYGKYGIEVKNTGKNLFDKSTIQDNKAILFANGSLTTDNSYISSDFIQIEPNENYYCNYTIFGSSYFGLAFYDSNKSYLLGNKITNLITTPSNAKYLRFCVRKVTPNTTNIDTLQLEKGSTATDYEPYHSSSSLFILDQPLRSLPNGVKDIAYIKNNILYVDRKVGSVVLNGSEDWQGYKNLGNNVRAYITKSNILRQSNGYSNYFQIKTSQSNYEIDETSIMLRPYTDSTIVIKIPTSELNTIDIAGIKNWLSTHNTQVDYELAEPYTEEVGEVETLSTFKGVNNVSLDTNVQTNMTIIYPTEYEELDKHFLKDVNVSFSKKYGAINSVVFSRGGGTDNIYRKDNASINKNGLTEIKITGNPFLEGDDRENFIQSLFDKINGLEFYIMDVASTGIMYLELGDLYYFNMIEDKPSLKSGLVKSGMRKAQGSSGGKFLCLLMNDEPKITQGLEESIYTDEPEITETDYKTASITDTSIKNAIIQTNKNSAEILLKVNSDEVVSAINLSPENIKISSAKLDIDAIATFTNSKLAEAGSTVINGANITTGSINCDRLNGGTINGQAIRGGSISITTGNYYFNMGTSTSNPNCSGLNVGSYGVKAYSDITATGFAITDSDTGKSQPVNIYDGHGHVHYLTFTGGILTKWEYK